MLVHGPASLLCNCGLLRFESTSYQISLITDATQLIAQASKAQRVDRAVVGLQVIRAPDHRLAGSDEFIGNRHAVEPAVESFFFAFDEAWQKRSVRS